MKVSIKTKIILTTFACITIVIITSGLFVYHYITGVIKQKSIDDNKVRLAQLLQQIEKIQDQTLKTAEYIITDDDVNKLTVKNPGEGIESQYSKKWDMSELLRRFVVLNGYTSNATIVRDDGYVISNNNGFDDYKAYYIEKTKEAWYKNFISSNRNFKFTGIHSTFIQRQEEPVISFMIKYTNPQSTKKLKSTNVLILDIKYAVFEDILGKNTDNFDKLILLDEDGNIVNRNETPKNKLDLSKMKEAINKNIAFFENNNNIVLINTSKTHNFKAVEVIQKNKIYSKINVLFNYFIVIIVMSLLLVLIIMVPLTINITKPIFKLTGAMNRVSMGDLQTSIEINSGDEFEVLGEGFNKMIAQLNDDMHQLIENEKMKRRMQIDLLLSQINPHFIYNTLNSVIYLVSDNKNQDAINITESLISILQDTIKVGDKSTFGTIKDEINVINQYLKIQNYRYPERFHTSFNIDSSLEDIKIPKMIIQPIVENALFHGVCQAEHLGLIEVCILKHEDKLFISVEDNGIGMSDDKVSKIFETGEKHKATNKTRSIGIKNIKDRIDYLYGSDCSMEVWSKVGEGTKVTLTIPIEVKM